MEWPQSHVGSRLQPFCTSKAASEKCQGAREGAPDPSPECWSLAPWKKAIYFDPKNLWQFLTEGPGIASSITIETTLAMNYAKKFAAKLSTVAVRINEHAIPPPSPYQLDETQVDMSLGSTEVRTMWQGRPAAKLCPLSNSSAFCNGYTRWSAHSSSTNTVLKQDKTPNAVILTRRIDSFSV